VELLPEEEWLRGSSAHAAASGGGGRVGGAGPATEAPEALLERLSLRADEAAVSPAPMSPPPLIGGEAHDSEPALPEAAAAALSLALWQPDAALLAVDPPPHVRGASAAASAAAAPSASPPRNLPAVFAAAVRESAAYAAAIAAVSARTGARGGGGESPSRPQACGRIVSILLAVHPRSVVGVLRAADDTHPAHLPIPDRHAYVRLAPLDGRVPYLVIPRTDVPAEDRSFFDCPAAYSRKLFAASLGRWGTAGRFPVGHLKGGFGEAGEIASETAVRGLHAC